MRADRQFHDSRRNVSIAEGNVRVVLGHDELQADRIEFDAAYRTLFARGSVRLRRGGQFFQASSFRYSLIQNEGQLDDVYGVIDLRESDSGFFQAVSAEPQAASEERQTNGSMVQESPAMACPPLLPPIPDWHPQPWALTAWGGQMIDSNFGDTFLFNGRMRPEYLLGIGLQKRILRAGPLSLELEADLFGHKAGKQPGGEFNQSTPFADLPAQSFGEGIVGIGARLWVQPWLSFGFIEGISYNTDYSLYEKTYRENYTQLLNYLGFEVEAAFHPISPWSDASTIDPEPSGPTAAWRRAAMRISLACDTAGERSNRICSLVKCHPRWDVPIQIATTGSNPHPCLSVSNQWPSVMAAPL